MKNSKAIIFDLGGVILNVDYQNTINELFKLGLRNASDFYSKQIQTNLVNRFETGDISSKEFLAKLQKETKNTTIYQLEKAWNSMLLDLPKGRINLLRELRKEYPIFLLSNTNTIHISAIKKYLGKNTYYKFYNLFNKVYYSHEIGFRKPNKEAFQLILQENYLNSHEVLFIDDSHQHIKGAKQLGLNTYHLKEGEEITVLFSDIIQ